MMTGTGAIAFERAVTLFGDIGIRHDVESKRSTDGTTAKTLPSAKEELEPLPAEGGRSVGDNDGSLDLRGEVMVQFERGSAPGFLQRAQPRNLGWSGRNQAQCWWALRSCCCRLLVG